MLRQSPLTGSNVVRVFVEQDSKNWVIVAIWHDTASAAEQSNINILMPCRVSRIALGRKRRIPGVDFNANNGGDNALSTVK